MQKNRKNRNLKSVASTIPPHRRLSRWAV